MRLDLRHEVPTAQPKTRVRRGATVLRDPATVDGIVVHQMATRLTITKRWLKRAGGDHELAQGRRAARTACHCAAMRSGLVVMTRPLQSYVWHGNGFNVRSLGLEIEGLYEGIEGNPRTVRRVVRHRLDEVTPEVIEASRDALTWMVEEGARLGMPLRYVWAHRQSSPTRRADPGSGLWGPVVLDHAVKVLGLEVQNAVVLTSRSRKARGSGRPIPPEWDPQDGVGAY